VLVTEAENQGILVENFKGAMTLKTSHGTPQAWDELQALLGRLANITFRTVQLAILNSFTSTLISGAGAIAILWFGGWLVIQQTLSIGQLLAFNALYRYVTSFVSSVIRFIDEFARAKTAMQRLGEIIEASPETAQECVKPWVDIAADGDIICSQLTFHHAGRLDLLQDFSLTIPGGKVTALIGKSGCGKSTLAKLIAGLYSLHSGNIRIGKYDQRDLPLDCWRQQVILVPQEPHFWSRSIFENFRLSYPDASFEEIITACEMTEADAFIRQLPDQYQTVLGEFGANLSGGQKQRLAIARALVSNPPILILDESTGALDPVSEKEILHHLLEYRRGKTTIMISHRPQVIQQAEWIVVLEDGKLSQIGTPLQLKQCSGQHLDFLNA
jgi:ATP-binding cassette subfamily C protein